MIDYMIFVLWHGHADIFVLACLAYFSSLFSKSSFFCPVSSFPFRTAFSLPSLRLHVMMFNITCWWTLYFVFLLQFLANYLWFGMSLEEAIAKPRIHSDAFPTQVVVEDTLSLTLTHELENKYAQVPIVNKTGKSIVLNLLITFCSFRFTMFLSMASNKTMKLKVAIIYQSHCRWRQHWIEFPSHF